MSAKRTVVTRTITEEVHAARSQQQQPQQQQQSPRPRYHRRRHHHRAAPPRYFPPIEDVSSVSTTGERGTHSDEDATPSSSSSLSSGWDCSAPAITAARRRRRMETHTTVVVEPPERSTTDLACTRPQKRSRQHGPDDPLACTICIEEQYYLKCLKEASSGGGDSRSRALTVKQTLEFQKEIFELERMLSLSQSDEMVFSSMLRARKIYVERFLDKHSIGYTPWTLDMLRRHYDVRSPTRHHFDAERLLIDDLNRGTEIVDQIRATALVLINPDDGSKRIDLKAAAELRQWSRRRQEIILEIARCKRDRGSATPPDVLARAIATALRSTENLALNAIEPAPRSDVYGFGGL